MDIQKVISKLEDYENQLNEIKNKPPKKNQDLMLSIKTKIKSIILELYSKKEKEELFEDLFYAPFGLYNDVGFSFNSDVESCLKAIQIIKEDYELGKFDKNNEVNINSSVPNINITNTNLNQNLNQMNISITSFSDIYNILDKTNYPNKEELKGIIKEIEKEVKKENIRKSKIKGLLDKLKQKGGDFLRQIPLGVLTNLIAQSIAQEITRGM